MPAWAHLSTENSATRIISSKGAHRALYTHRAALRNTPLRAFLSPYIRIYIYMYASLGGFFATAELEPNMRKHSPSVAKTSTSQRLRLPSTPTSCRNTYWPTRARAHMNVLVTPSSVGGNRACVKNAGRRLARAGLLLLTDRSRKPGAKWIPL